jgi:hypothetical protein
MIRLRKTLPPTPRKTVVAKTEAAFLQALNAINVRDQIHYHTGHLHSDWDVFGEMSDSEIAKRKILRSFRYTVYRLYLEGRIYLVQKRISEKKGCQYFAVKRSVNR